MNLLLNCKCVLVADNYIFVFLLLNYAQHEGQPKMSLSVVDLARYRFGRLPASRPHIFSLCVCCF